jgi:hypothetical protein
MAIASAQTPYYPGLLPAAAAASSMKDRFGREIHTGPDAGLEGLRARISPSDDPVNLEPGRVVRMRSLWIKVRFLMVVVAFAAIVTEAGLVGWRAVTYRMRANDHARHLNSGKSFLYDSTKLRAWHERMRRKYQQGASSPWLAVEPEPPPE